MPSCPSVTQCWTAPTPIALLIYQLRRKAAIGTAVHRAAHYHAERDLVEASVTSEVAMRFAAWKWFTETRQVEDAAL